MSEEKLVPKLRFSGFNDGWEKYFLSDVIETFINGQTPSRNVDSYWNGDIPWVSSGELNYNHITSTIEQITEEGKKNANLKLIPSGTFLMAITGLEAPGTRGSCAILDIEATTNQSCMALFPKKEILTTKFLYYWYLKVGEHYGIKYTQGTKQQSYNKELLEKLPISLPSTIKEQNKITDFLSSLNQKIELLQEKHDYYQNFKKYLMQQIFAQKLRFNTSSSYSNYKLKDIVTKFSTGLNPRKNFKLNEGGENFYVTIKNFQNGILNLDDKCDKIDDNALKLINKRSDLKKDDLIFASIGRVGEVYLIKNNPINWNINESVFSLRPNKQFIEPKFLYYLLNSTKIQNYFESNITGSTFKSIKMKDLKNTPVTIPDSFELQNKIIQFLSSVDSKIVLVDNELNNIQKFKKGLLQQMFV